MTGDWGQTVDACHLAHVTAVKALAVVGGSIAPMVVVVADGLVTPCIGTTLADAVAGARSLQNTLAGRTLHGVVLHGVGTIEENPEAWTVAVNGAGERSARCAAVGLHPSHDLGRVVDQMGEAIPAAHALARHLRARES